MEMDFSIVIPAFNEGQRLTPFLLDLSKQINVSHLKGEIIVVDDGSILGDSQIYQDVIKQIIELPSNNQNSKSLTNVDHTSERFAEGLSGVGKEKLNNRPDIKLIRHPQNQGKGAAILTGLNNAEGEWIGFVDADGATSSKEIIRLLELARNSPHMDGVFGSRIKMLGYKIERSCLRHIIGRVFVSLVSRFLHVPTYDPQCGCKFFRRSKIKFFLEKCYERGFLFDIELIAMGYRKKLNFVEVPISWQDIPGGKVSLLKDPIKMFLGLLRIRKRLK